MKACDGLRNHRHNQAAILKAIESVQQSKQLCGETDTEPMAAAAVDRPKRDTSKQTHELEHTGSHYGLVTFIWTETEYSRHSRPKMNGNAASTKGWPPHAHSTLETLETIHFLLHKNVVKWSARTASILRWTRFHLNCHPHISFSLSLSMCECP